MGKYTQFNHLQYVESELQSLIRRTVKYRYSQHTYLNERAKIYAENSYRRLTLQNREYIRGYERSAMRHVIEPLLVHTYMFPDGQRRSSYQQYRADYEAALDRCGGYEQLDVTTGAFVWNTPELDKVWS